MPYFVGLDVSKRMTSICVMDRDGKVVREGSVATDPKTISSFLRGERRRYSRVGLEAWSLAPWLYEGLTAAGLPAICIETRQAHGVMKAQRHKTDRNDARGIAELMRVGAYRAVHVKSHASQGTRALLRTRSFLREKATDVSNAIHGLLLSFGLKLGRLQWKSYESRVRALVAGRSAIEQVAVALLAVRANVLKHVDEVQSQLVAMARADPVCQRLMTAPGVGELTALAFRAAIDEPGRFPRSRAVGPHFGLTPKLRQSGDTKRVGRVTRWGDREVRQALFLVGWSLFRSNRKASSLRDWAFEVAARRGRLKASLAAARKFAVILHRMWVTETDFQWERT